MNIHCGATFNRHNNAKNSDSKNPDSKNDRDARRSILYDVGQVCTENCIFIICLNNCLPSCLQLCTHHSHSRTYMFVLLGLRHPHYASKLFKNTTEQVARTCNCLVRHKNRGLMYGNMQNVHRVRRQRSRNFETVSKRGLETLYLSSLQKLLHSPLFVQFFTFHSFAGTSHALR